MKKIGIMTFHNTTNYGAILQCYALQKYINDNLATCEVIDYNNDFLKKNYDINPLKASTIKDFVKKVLFFVPEYYNHKYFKQFTRDYIMVSSTKYNENNISTSNSEYSSFIVGSDQIWNYSLSGNDDNYLLNFCNDSSKKNSYAASFGSNKSYLDNKSKMLDNLKSFNNISVREDEIVDILKDDLENKDVIQSIDPVFLLSKQDWENILIRNKTRKPYIFVYEVARTPLLREFAKKLSEKYNLEIVYLSKSGKKMNNVKKLYSVSPIEFINYIKNAEYVVTSSFHGLAFSLIFEKQFYFDTHEKNGEFSSRLSSLSRISKTESRKINNVFESNDFNMINYDNVNILLAKEINKSYSYLSNVIKELDRK